MLRRGEWPHADAICERAEEGSALPAGGAMRKPGQGGSALLLVLGATAALSALALATLSVSLLAYHIAVLEHQGVQARLLARTGLDLAFAEFAAGRLSAPPLGLETSWQANLPAPPPGAPPLPPGCEVTVRLARVNAASALPVLVDASAEAHCGRGYGQRAGRFARAADGTVRLSY